MMIALQVRGFSSSAKLIKGFHRPLYRIGEETISLSQNPEEKGLILGWTVRTLPAELHIGFRENPELKSSILQLIKQHGPDSAYLKSLAAAWNDGWMHIADGRSIAAFGRCPEPDDIFATVLVRQGKMLASTIQAMPTHRLLTVNGLFQLPADLDRLLFK